MPGYMNEHVDEYMATLDEGGDKAKRLRAISDMIAKKYELLLIEVIWMADQSDLKREVVLSYFDHVIEAGVDYDGIHY